MLSHSGYTHIWGTPTYLSLLVSSQLKVLAPLNRQHPLGPAVGLHALQPQHNFLCGLGLGGEEQRVISEKCPEVGDSSSWGQPVTCAALDSPADSSNIKRKPATQLGCLR